MDKKMQLVQGNKGGVNLLVERDAGNEVLILTGNNKTSKKFWAKMREMCDSVLQDIDDYNESDRYHA